MYKLNKINMKKKILLKNGNKELILVNVFLILQLFF